LNALAAILHSKNGRIRPVFECFGHHFVLAIQNPDKLFGFQMVGGHFGFLTTSLDHFVMNKIIVMTVINKTVWASDHLKTGPFGIRMRNRPFKNRNGPVFGC
jgi:hypothetical protein